MNWFDNETESYFEVGNEVIWIGDDEMTGVIKDITSQTFTVLWDDGKEIEYSDLYQDMVNKY